MKGSLLLVGVIVVYLVIGGVAAELGLTEPLFDANVQVPDAPSEDGNWLDALTSVLAPIAWAFNALSGIFQLATYQTPDVPPLVNTLILFPMGAMLVYTGFKMIRG